MRGIKQPGDGSREGTHRRTVALVVLALAVAACSGGGENASSDSTDDASTVSEPAPATDAPTTTTAPEPKYLSGDSDYLFDQSMMHTFEITVDPTLLEQLDDDPAAEEYVEGSLTFEGETISPIGVRYKGSVGAFVGCTDGPNPIDPSGAKTCDKLSMKLKINWDDPNAEFYGVRKVQLHSQNLDATMMHERLGYWLFAEMGVVVPRSTHARVMINGEFAGVFALTEQIDGRFTRESFENGKGNLYKEAWPFDAEGLPVAAADLIAALETNEDDNPSADITTDFTAALLAASPENRLDVLSDTIDVPNLLATLVVDRAIRNDDGSLHWYCFGPCAPHNFFWYEDPDSEQLWLIPWDLDNAFETLGVGGLTADFIRIADPLFQTTSDCQPFAFGNFGLLQRSASCDPIIGTVAALTAEYDALRAELVAGPMSAASVTEQLAEWSAQIEPSVAEYSAAHPTAPTVDQWKAAVATLQSDIINSLAGEGR